MMTMYPPIGVDNLILADFELEQFGIEGKKFEKIKEADKQPIDFITIEELSRFLGAKV